MTETVCKSNFDHFQPLDCDKVLSIIKKSRVKTCPLDPFPATLIDTYLSFCLQLHL